MLDDPLLAANVKAERSRKERIADLSQHETDLMAACLVDKNLTGIKFDDVANLEYAKEK